MSIGLSRATINRLLNEGKFSEEDKQIIVKVIDRNNREIEEAIKKEVREIERKIRNL